MVAIIEWWIIVVVDVLGEYVLVEPDMQIARIRLSDKISRLSPTMAELGQAYEPETLSTMRLMLSFDGRWPKRALPVVGEYIRPNVYPSGSRTRSHAFTQTDNGY